MANNGWQAIETAPKDGTPVLASTEGVMYVAWFRPIDGGKWCFFEHTTRRISFKPTHWMALPELPDS